MMSRLSLIFYITVIFVILIGLSLYNNCIGRMQFFNNDETLITPWNRTLIDVCKFPPIPEVIK